MFEPKRTEPSWSLMKEPARYTDSSSTDVQATWRRFGWLPRSERMAHEAQKKQ